jgi:trimethylamine--corrinoid protein Co-methyltransferase
MINAFKPRLRILDDEQVRRIHSATLEVLERTGVEITHPQALELLHGAGASVDGSRVRIPSWLVEQSIRTAPSRVILGNRDGQRSVYLERDRSWFGPSLDCIDYLDPQTNQRRRFVSDDCRITASLADQLGNYSWVMTIGMADDVPPDIADRVIAKQVFTYCRKPLVFCCKDAQSVRDVYEMALVIAGSEENFQRAPTIVQYTEPISPLLYYDPGIEKIIYCAENGIPLINYPAPQAGSTAPATFAGTIVQGSAESLSGLVIAQLVRPGSPYIYGAFATVMDMSTTVFSYGAPEMSLMVAAMAQLAQYYQLPFFGTAGCSDAKAPDPQSAAEAAFSCLSSAMSGANLVHDSGWLDHGSLASPAYMLLVNEILSMVGQYMKGVPLEEETLAVDLIDRVGPGSHYLQEDHTYRHFKDVWYSNLFDRSIFDQWMERGAKSFADRLQELTLSLMEQEPDPLSEEVLAELERMEQTWA